MVAVACYPSVTGGLETRLWIDPDMLAPLQRIATWLQLDRTLSLSLVARLWQAISGPITIMLLMVTLDQHEQGLFHGILNTIAIQPLFELGMGSVLIGQAGNVLGANRGVASAAAGELSGLARAAGLWFGGIAVLYAVVSWAMGWTVLSGSGTSVVDWRWPLGVSVGLAAASLAIAPRLYVLEGGGAREFIYRLRLWQAMAGSVAMWVALGLGFKLWACVAILAVAAGFHLAMAYGPRAQRLLTAAGEPPRTTPRAWLARIAPLQWRTAAGSGLHYLASPQLCYLYVLNYHAAREAAPLGLTLQITTAVQGVALAWAQTKFPLIADWRAQGDRERAGNLWRQTTLVSASLLLLAMLALALAILGLALFNRGWAERFLPPGMILLLAVGYLANHGLALQAFYVLAAGGKPLVVASVTGLGITALAVWWGAKAYGIPGGIAAYSGCMAGVTLPLHTWAYLRFRAHVRHGVDASSAGGA